MSRVAWFFVVWSMGVSGLVSPVIALAADRPNLLWITCEDMSPDLGCYGAPGAWTPRIDRLASEGTRYTRVFTVAGVCAPSRSGIITGMYPTSIGTMHMRSQGVPPAHVRCFPEYLRAAGYYCTNNVKTDYNFEVPPSAWDESSPRAHYRRRDKGQPFFAVFNTTTTHESQIRVSDAEFEKKVARVPKERRHSPDLAVLPPYYPDTAVVRRDWARYQDLISAMDIEVGELLDELEREGLADSTIVVFYSDHGRGLPRAKRWTYDSGIHIPMIVRMPSGLRKEPVGTVNDRLISSLDFAPTVLSLAGVAPPAHLQGTAFLGSFAGTEHKYLFAARDRMDETYDIIRAVRDTRYKYIRNFQPEKPYAQYIDYMDQMPTLKEWRRLNKEGLLHGPQTLFFQPSKPVEELYDTNVDPHEVVNLASKPEHAATLTRFRDRLAQWQKETGDLGLVPEPELKERMRPGGAWQVTATPVLSVRTEGGHSVVSGTSATEGASLVYTLEEGPRPRWKLMFEPVPVMGTATVRVKANRLGYRDSPEAIVRVGAASR